MYSRNGPQCRLQRFLGGHSRNRWQHQTNGLVARLDPLPIQDGLCPSPVSIPAIQGLHHKAGNHRIPRTSVDGKGIPLGLGDEAVYRHLQQAFSVE